MSRRTNGLAVPHDEGFGEVVRALNAVAQAMQQQVNLNQNAPPPPPPPNQRALLVRSVNDEDKLDLAVFKLEGESTRWWDLTRRSRNDGLFTWVEFRLAFLNKYFPQTARNQRMIEFMQLTQRNMTVAQYQAKFEELSRFAIHLVENEELKAFKFQEGLRPSIKGRLSILKITSYNEIVERAMIAERDIEEANRIRERHNGDKNKNKNNNHPYHKKGNGPNMELPAPSCYHCKQPGHFKRNCPALISQRNQQPFIPQNQRQGYQQNRPQNNPPQYQARQPPQQPKAFNIAHVGQDPDNSVVEGVASAIGSSARIDRVARMCVVRIAKHEFLIDLFVMNMSGYDVILGMDWLSAHHAVFDCFQKRVTLHSDEGSVVHFTGTRSFASPLILSERHFRQTHSRGFLYHLVMIGDEQQDSVSTMGIPVVEEFEDVFPEELPGLPPRRNGLHY
ncbi:uncharacterized protein LOC113295693 [Papaver somniferum]|uniref:uncharacterized protein LOC113295693 n=1 Tax=Papaver somniferum TaxID=3469 RepID=UPI000E6FF875|nr:uncharacterized protein LOC113295693 [Papaver somniferum]